MPVLEQVAIGAAALVLSLGVLHLLMPLLLKMEIGDGRDLRFLIFRVIPVRSIPLNRIVAIERIGFGAAFWRALVRPTWSWIDRPWGKLVWIVTDTGSNIVASTEYADALIKAVRATRP